MKLKELREQRGISREQLAAAVKTSYPNIVRLESGTSKPRIDLAVAIAKFFGVPVESIEWGQPPDDAEGKGVRAAVA